MKLRFEEGDATRPSGEGPRIIVHLCNDVGAWGKGFVAALSKRWAEPERSYRLWHHGRENNDFALGQVQLVKVEREIWVANLIGQRGLQPSGGKPPVRYEAVALGLQRVRDAALERSASVHMPRIGSGLAGGRWEAIEAIVRTELLDEGVAVTVYDLPTAGTSA